MSIVFFFRYRKDSCFCLECKVVLYLKINFVSEKIKERLEEWHAVCSKRSLWET